MRRFTKNLLNATCFLRGEGEDLHVQLFTVLWKACVFMQNDNALWHQECKCLLGNMALLQTVNFHSDDKHCPSSFTSLNGQFSTQWTVQLSILKNRPNSSSPSSFLVHCTHSHSEHISHHDIHFCEWCIRVISNIYHCIQTLWMDWNFETLPPLTSKQRF